MPSLTPEGIQQLIQQTRQEMQDNGNLPGQEGEAASGNVILPEKDTKEETKKDELQLSADATEISTLENLYRNNYETDAAKKLDQFGYQIFASSTYNSSRLAVPDADYILGPGDKLRIRVWGSGLDAEFTGAIDKDGSINVPKIGIVPITGVRFGDAESVIRQEAEKYVQGINISVSLAELRSIEIYVVGEVVTPGLRLAPPFTTVLGGLISTGGIKKSGSLRNIQLYRDGMLHATIDLYDLLLQGSRQDDVLLTDRDVIFVPRIGPTAAVIGAVAQPAIYELSGEHSVTDLLQLAGNQLPQTSGGRIYLRRFQDNRTFQVLDIEASAKDVHLGDIAIQNGDLLELQFLGASWPQNISLEGQVWKPDVFAYKPGIMLSQILTGPELLKPGAVTEYAMLYRYDLRTTRYTVQSLSLDKLFRGEFDLALQPHDQIKVLARDDFNMQEPIRIDGAVRKTGEFPYYHDMKLGDILGLTGGFSFGADTSRIDVSRQQIVGSSMTTDHIVVDIAEAKDFPLQPYDYIFVRRIKDATSFMQVEISGEVKYPGIYRIKQNERLADLIERAGGYTDSAYLYGAQYFSSDAQKIQQRSLDQLIDDLEIRAETVLADQVQTVSDTSDAKAIEANRGTLRNLIAKLRGVKASGRVSIQLAADLQTLRDSPFNLVLENGDRLNIPKQMEFVSVVGSVYNPNSFLYQPDFAVKDYLGRAGGPAKGADEKYIYVLKANGEVASNAQQGMFFNRFENLRLMPSDTIVVPEKLDRIPILMISRDIADIIFKIATTAGVALSL
ncbi:MAG: SLBB domain-containing protein [Deltaproteobacteria bacterium]|nr:SLBB domain-containing protein [Deltaproteobacteria bacterium]